MKHLPELKGLERLRTLHSTKHRSIPRIQRSSEIELFLLEKERERFLKEAERIKKRLATVYDRIEVLSAEISLQQSIRAERQQEQQRQVEALPAIRAMLQGELPPKNADASSWVAKKNPY